MRLKKTADNILFTLNIFIVFFVIFKDSIQVAAWLQPVGRLHPLILHFPIVLLILTLASIFFRFTNEQHKQFQQQLTEQLLLSGALFSALTVITGLFLSKEEGYEGRALQLHMWTGISIVFAASFIYWFRNTLLNYSWLYKTISLLSIFLIAVTGHYGATLTHGEDFIFPDKGQPLAQVKLQDAIVFDHIVMPVIQRKCQSCHNKEKSKGNLLLIDSLSFLKGGKTGKLFDPAKPALSLLLKRIHLPAEDEKRMPPPGKPQLTDEELSLLELWISAGAPFHTKVTDLPAQDSLRQVASGFLDTQETFDFAAADENTVKNLNNNYRLVTPLAKESPALSVKLYNRNEYSLQKIQELLPIKTQVVSLDLNKLPVKDEDLKLIAQFGNLRTLHLNFTDISGAGLQELKALKNLKSISLSGTNVKPENLDALKSMENLQQVTLWSTVITDAEIPNLKQRFPNTVFITGFNDGGIPEKLIPPQLSNNSVVFKDKLPVALKHPIPGVDIRYTTDGSEPDSILSSSLNTDAFLAENTTIKAKAFKKGWYSSDVAEFSFLRNAHKPDSMYFLIGPYENYRGDGVYTFFDGELGGYNIYRYTKNKWVGFKDKNMELMLIYAKPRTIQSVALHALVSVPAKTFPPAFIEIWGGNSADNMKLLSRIKPQMPSEKDPQKLENIASNFKAENITYLKIIAQPTTYPSWLPDKGKPAQVLIDEILIN